MEAAVYVWQFPDDYPDSTPDSALPFRQVWVKTHSGPHWMGTFYQHPAAPVSTASVTHLARLYAAQGLELVPWWEPTGRDREGELARCLEVLEGLRLAEVPQRLVFDLEWEASTPYFWKGTPEDVVWLCAGIRERFPEARLGLCHYQYDEIGFARIADSFDFFSTMDYWNDFRTTPEARLAWSWGRLRERGKPVVWGLPGNAPAGEMARALDWVAGHGGQAVVWRRGTLSAENRGVLAERFPAVPPPAEEQPMGNDAALQFRIDRARECLDGDLVTAYQHLGDLLTELSGTPLPPPEERGSGEPQPPVSEKPPLRDRLPSPWLAAVFGAAIMAGQVVLDAVNAGTLRIPDEGVKALVVGLLPLILATLRSTSR